MYLYMISTSFEVSLSENNRRLRLQQQVPPVRCDICNKSKSSTAKGTLECIKFIGMLR